MSEEILINKEIDDAGIYEQILPQVEELINGNEPVVTGLSNITSLLKTAFDKISWVGFYLVRDNKLFLGPFQGNTACTVIEFNKGVCGTAAERRETIIVDSVEEFPGHIACDAGSRSEIVVPLVYKKNVAGVLDLDSYKYSAFGATDKKYLEQLCEILINKLNWEEFSLS
ncbi:MAG: GAF domain-containing protein [Melioribacteraceae bacterium]|nr:GAF domain-containing protein [Melioribacteraceae bacterium]